MIICIMEGGGKDVSGLVTKDEIEVPAIQGLSKIQLSYGSVTKLSKEDEVDVLVISAFPSKLCQLSAYVNRDHRHASHVSKL